LGRYFRAKIRENLPLNRNHKLLTLETSSPVNEPLPGQFYMLGVNRGGYDPLLKRAFSLFRNTSDGFQMLYRIKGKGTSLLGSMKEGDMIDMIGPLGRSYPVPETGRTPLVIAGGVGMASVFSLIESIPKRSYVFYGARSKDELFMLDELGALCKGLYISTDDGSLGKKGSIAGVLEDFLGRKHETEDQYLIYACGPKPLLGLIARTASSHSIQAFVSLEEQMACGIGACLGCAVRVKSPVSVLQGSEQDFIYRKVCKDGPVFDAAEILW